MQPFPAAHPVVLKLLFADTLVKIQSVLVLVLKTSVTGEDAAAALVIVSMLIAHCWAEQLGRVPVPGWQALVEKPEVVAGISINLGSSEPLEPLT
jgi:hypothetical protein